MLSVRNDSTTLIRKTNPIFFPLRSFAPSSAAIKSFHAQVPSPIRTKTGLFNLEKNKKLTG